MLQKDKIVDYVVMWPHLRFVELRRLRNSQRSTLSIYW